jgi:opacity protein-like surface antigen
MRTFLIATAATVAIATPAAAKDGSPYVGIEGGVVKPKSQNIFGNIDFTNTTTTDFAGTNIGRARYNAGLDADLVGGYDFGMFRLEGELGYKRSKIKNVTYTPGFIGALNGGAGTAFTQQTTFGINRNSSVWSAMVNGLVDLGGNTGIGGYVGGGAGYANVRQFGSSNGKFAWQLLAGVYFPVSDNIDIGLKYRYFRAGRGNGTQSYAFSPVTGACGTVACSGGTAFFQDTGRYSSNSLLASLVYNFGGTAAAPPPPPPPPPPPAPAAPATQTCPDGSVIEATATCPAPPPPPPPPAPAQRGERG